MKFDVVVGNPPYQREANENKSNGNNTIYKAAYAEFIDKSLEVSNEIVSMIVPAKWMSDKQTSLAQIRHKLKDNGHLKTIVDYKDSLECFEGIRVVGGICHFNHNYKYTGDCTIKNISMGRENTATRDIVNNEYIIRDNIGVSILNKVLSKSVNFMDKYVESSYFDIKNNNKGTDTKENVDDYEILSSGNNTMQIKYIKYDDIQRNRHVAEDEYKLVIGKMLAGGGDHPVDKNGQMKIVSGIYKAKPGQVFVSTYIMVIHNKDKNIIDNCEKYIKTRFARFMLYLGMAGLNITAESFRYVPLMDFNKEITESEIYDYFGLSEVEIKFINNFIKEID